MPKQITFICIFNVQRSLAAEHLLRKMLYEKRPDCRNKVTVFSAGLVGKKTSQWFKTNGLPLPVPLFNRTPSSLFQAMLLERGMDVSPHRSRPVNRGILDRSHLIVPFLAMLKEDLIIKYPAIKEKVVLPKELLGGEASFYWEDYWQDTTVLPNGSLTYDFAHSDTSYVSAVVNEIEEFLKKAFPEIVRRLLGESG